MVQKNRPGQTVLRQRGNKAGQRLECSGHRIHNHFCLEALLAWFIYFQIENGSWFNQPSDGSINYVSLNQNLLQKITGELEAKSAVYFASSTPQKISDPSL